MSTGFEILHYFSSLCATKSFQMDKKKPVFFSILFEIFLQMQQFAEIPLRILFLKHGGAVEQTSSPQLQHFNEAVSL